MSRLFQHFQDFFLLCFLPFALTITQPFVFSFLRELCFCSPSCLCRWSCLALLLTPISGCSIHNGSQYSTAWKRKCSPTSCQNSIIPAHRIFPLAKSFSTGNTCFDSFAKIVLMSNSNVYVFSTWNIKNFFRAKKRQSPLFKNFANSCHIYIFVKK